MKFRIYLVLSFPTFIIQYSLFNIRYLEFVCIDKPQKGDAIIKGGVKNLEQKKLSSTKKPSHIEKALFF